MKVYAVSGVFVEPSPGVGGGSYGLNVGGVGSDLEDEINGQLRVGVEVDWPTRVGGCEVDDGLGKGCDLAVNSDRVGESGGA